MSKKDTKIAPAKNSTPAGNGAVNNPPATNTAPLGTKGNPISRDAYSGLEKEARLICTFEGKKGAWVSLKDGAKFVSDGEGIRGRVEGSVNSEGSNSRKFVAPRLKLPPADFIALLPKKAEELTGTPLADENYKARQKKAEVGLSLIQAVQDSVKVTLPASPARTIERSRTEAEVAALFAECAGDMGRFAGLLAASPTIKEALPETPGGEFTLADIAAGKAGAVQAGAHAEIRRAVMEAVNTAIEVLTA